MLTAWSARKISAERSISRGRRPPFAEGELTRRGHRSPSGQIRPRRAPLARAPRRRSRSFVPVCAVGSALPCAYAPWSLASSRASFVVVPSWIRTAIRRSRRRRSRNEAESKRCLGTARSRASCHRRCRHRRHRERQTEPSRARTPRTLWCNPLLPASVKPHRGHLITLRLRIHARESRRAVPTRSRRSPAIACDASSRARVASLPPGPIHADRGRSQFRECIFCARPSSSSEREERRNLWNLWVLVDAASSDRKDFRKIGAHRAN